MFDSKHSLMYIRALDATPHGWGWVRWYAPDAGALVLVTVLALAAVRARRIARHPQRAGSWYCRRCNYELTNPEAAGVCPECGVIEVGPSRARRGKSTRRRLVVLAALVVPLIGACASGLTWGLQRFAGGPFESRPWPTSWMGYLGPKWLFSKPLTVGTAQYAWRTNRYLPVRLPDGSAAGPELPIVPGCNYGHVLSEDGRWLATMTQMDSDGHIELVAYDTTNGTTKQQPMTGAGAPRAFVNMFDLPALGSSGYRFANHDGAFVDGAKEFTPRLYSINLGAQAPRMVDEVAAVTLPTLPYPANPGGTVPCMVSFAALSRPEGVAWAMVSFGLDGNGGLTKPPNLTSIDEQGHLRTVPLSQPVTPGWYMRLQDDGATIELEDENTWLTYRVRAADGSVSLACARHRELVEFAENGVTAYVDENGELRAAMDGQAPFATLKTGGRQVWPSGVSPDGRWVAAHSFGHRRPSLCPDCVQALRTDDVLVWDLKDVLPKSISAPASPRQNAGESPR